MSWRTVVEAVIAVDCDGPGCDVSVESHSVPSDWAIVSAYNAGDRPDHTFHLCPCCIALTPVAALLGRNVIGCSSWKEFDEP